MPLNKLIFKLYKVGFLIEPIRIFSCLVSNMELILEHLKMTNRNHFHFVKLNVNNFHIKTINDHLFRSLAILAHLYFQGQLYLRVNYIM